VRGTDVDENKLARDDGLDDVTLSQTKLGARLWKKQPIIVCSRHQPLQTITITSSELT